MGAGQLIGDSILSTLSFRRWGTAGKAKEVANNNLVALRKRRDVLLKTGGNYLQMLAMSARPEIREALRNTMSNTEPAFKEGFQNKMTFEQMRAQLDLPKTVEQAAVEERARAFAKTHEKILKNRRKVPDAEKLRKKYYLEERIRAAELEQKKKQGMWGELLLDGHTPYIDPRDDTKVYAGIDIILHK